MVKIDKLSVDNPERKMVINQHMWLWGNLYRYCLKYHPNKLEELMTLIERLWYNNKIQWDFENQVITLNGEEGLKAAKSSREYNMKRAIIKRRIDKLFEEKYLEVKQYDG